MPERYWLVLPNGGRQRIDPSQFDLDLLAEQARRIGGRLVVERTAGAVAASKSAHRNGYEIPVGALGPIFRNRFDQIYSCRHDYILDINTRPTVRVLGGYYKKRCLVRVYTHDRVGGCRPTEELFDTFLHEMAHHLEYTEPNSFNARACGRVHGRMHSDLFWRILGELKGRWNSLQRPGQA